MRAKSAGLSFGLYAGTAMKLPVSVILCRARERGTICRAGSSGVKILHSFAGTPDGSSPWGLPPRGSEGQLYGTTRSGGSVSYGGAGVGASVH